MSVCSSLRARSTCDLSCLDHSLSMPLFANRRSSIAPFAFVAGVLLLMVAGVWISPNRSIQLARRLQEEGRLLDLTAQEKRNLMAFLASLGAAAHAGKSFAVNEPYSRAKINVYI